MLGYIRLLKLLLILGETCYQKSVVLHICNLLDMKTKNHPIWNCFVNSVELWNEGRGENSLSVLESSTKHSTKKHDVNHLSKRYKMVELYRSCINEVTNEFLDTSRCTDGAVRHEVKIDSIEVTTLKKELLTIRRELNRGTFQIYPRQEKGRILYGNWSAVKSKLERPQTLKRIFIEDTTALLNTVFDKIQTTIQKFPTSFEDVFNMENPLQDARHDEIAVNYPLDSDDDNLVDVLNQMIDSSRNNINEDQDENFDEYNNADEINNSNVNGSLSPMLNQPNFDHIDAETDIVNDGILSDEDQQNQDSDLGEFLEEVSSKASAVVSVDTRDVLKSATKNAIINKKNIHKIKY